MTVFGKRVRVILLFLAMAVICPLSCYGENRGGTEEISATGILNKQGITTYMYGTHTLRDEAAKKLYALRSSKVDLDKYVGEKVTVKGKLVPGYPVDFGPDYLDVESVQKP